MTATRSPFSRRRVFAGRVALALLVASAAASPAFAWRPWRPAPDALLVKKVPAAAAREDVTKYLRVVTEEDASVALEIASRDFERSGAEGPTVTLVGVVHIGDPGYYRALQEKLAGYDLVLYESVKPAGTGGAGGDTHERRVETTRAAMRFLAGVIELHESRRGRYPATLEETAAFARAEDPRLGQFMATASVDAWGEPVRYEPADDVAETFRLRSFGADGRRGGEGPAADLMVSEPSDAISLSRSAEDNIQIQLAQALSLAFQLEALDYGAENWRCSDMAIDQVQAAMAERGADFTLVEGTLAGTSLPARLAKFLLGVVRMADMFTSGAVSDMLKVLLIEMLGDDEMIAEALGQFDEGFAEVIIDDRNQVVVDDLARLIEREEAGDRVAILYGAGHMPDLAERLGSQLGYQPRRASWLRAIEVDVERSAVSEAEIRRLRLMVRRMMRQMSRTQRR